MRERSKNETSNTFHLDRAFAGVVQWLDHPTLAGQSADAVPAVHAAAVRFHRHTGRDRSFHSLTNAERQHAHAEPNPIHNIDKHRRSRVAHTDSHIHSANIHLPVHLAQRDRMQNQH